ncbi:MAG: hypothetical protein RBR49_12000 [Desulfovibrio desulfuricans]|nr:hypothetical protein [uncultured Desulfovibrio sp.]MDY0204828.1 hypothetical protein [Desulfovibrio desulfuricans]
MEWLRWYHGAISDDKWPLIARKSGQPVAIVIAIWAALLECASQADDRGSIDAFDPESVDALLQLEDGTSQAVVDALSSGKRPRIAGGHIVNWSKRQPVREDGSAERAREWRERKKKEKSACPEEPNAGRTQTERTANAGRTQTNTDKIREDKKREEKNIYPVSSLENEDSARVEACAADINPAGTVPTEPSIDFQELRQFWDEHFRPEAPLAGFTEYKQLRAAKAYPGDSRIYEDLKARIDCQFWDQGFAPGLAKYLRERAWLRPPSATSRASPAANAKHESQADRAARLTYEAGMSVLAEMEQRGLNGGRALNAR